MRAFCDTTIKTISAAPIPAPQKPSRSPRCVAPSSPSTHAREKTISAAIDQYIEILNRFPDDDSLVREAALYAQQNVVAKKLHDYYAKTAADSPKDFHWPMVLARVETQMEDYPSAIESHTRAAVVCAPNAPTLLEERLSLDERLLRFEDAAVSAQKLYDLTYLNPMCI